MEPCPSTTQDGQDLTNAMYQLFGGEQQPGFSVLQQAMENSPTLPRTSQQPSSSLFQHQAAPHPVRWPAKRVVGGFTGPPVETGATLPYRDPCVPLNFGLASSVAPPTGVSRSITSGARQPQAQPQARTSTDNLPLASAPQLMFPAHASLEASILSQASMTCKLSAVQFPLSVAAGLAPSLLTRGGLHSTSSGSALPSKSASPDSDPSPKPSAWLTSGGEAGTWGSAGQEAPMAESPSLSSITSKEARAVLTKPSSSDLPPCDDSAKEPAAAAAVEGQQHIMLRQSSSDLALISEAQQQDEGGHAEGHRQQPPSNQTAAERRLDQGGLGQCGSHDHWFAYGENMSEEGGPDSGSDSGNMSAKGGKRSRCRGTSSEVQGSATDGDPCPRLKKRLDQTRQPEGLTESRKMTDAERRRIRRRVTNRESAKRIRDKREEQMTLMSAQVTKLEAHREALLSHMHSAEDCCAQLLEELKTLKNKWCATCVENVKLYKNIFELRKALNPDAASSYLASQIALTDDQPGAPYPPMPQPAPQHTAAPQSRCNSSDGHE
ncbi:hypothetical protein ABBQ32_012773 [Trebouxia sp. C0010 RCD-2024]